MSLPLRILPVIQRWDCHGCGDCCHGTIIALNEDDLSRLREQAWESHPDYRGQRIVRRSGWWKKSHQLAKRPDGSCIFLLPDGLCRIHKEYSFDAKPLVCRMFPYQLVPLESFAYLTLRRYCPSAAADEGRDVEEHLPEARRLADLRPAAAQPAGPPPVTARHRRPWNDFLRVAEVLQRLMLDTRYPHARRIAHGLQFCRLLDQCRLGKLDSGRLAALLEMFESSAIEEAAGVFRTRRPPGHAAAMLFRQTALEYVRLHPKYLAAPSWSGRWRLMRAAMAFARGRGTIPDLPAALAPATFASLEEPLGPLADDVMRPLDAWLAVAAASHQYALLGRRTWSLVESFRALALAHAIALWLLRLTAGPRPPERADMIDVVRTIDRGQSYDALCGPRHRRRVGSLARLGELPRLTAWYIR